MIIQWLRSRQEMVSGGVGGWVTGWGSIKGKKLVGRVDLVAMASTGSDLRPPTPQKANGPSGDICPRTPIGGPRV